MTSTVLITGGTGFLGRHLAENLRKEHRVILTARNNKQNMQAQSDTGCEVLPMDVTSIESVRDVVNAVRPDIVLHAAATKFVDLAERQPLECVDVNVVGSQNVARVALDKGVEVVIGISTDKAAPPVRNTYGLSKAIMERMFCALNGRARTKFACVRYGNVAWSTGSVLPIWRAMHTKTGIIGTTGPDMTRFFFTVDEAVALILTAMAHIIELQGKILARRMKSALIRDVLAVWVREYGGSWKQIEGRPGERTDEFLIGELELPYTAEQTYDGTPHYVISFNERAPRPLPTVLSSATAERLSNHEIRSMLSQAPKECA
jgi:FlaA1/EpsC-like NDP-sugar epimerase